MAEIEQPQPATPEQPASQEEPTAVDQGSTDTEGLTGLKTKHDTVKNSISNIR
jgi:hypothetical protein